MIIHDATEEVDEQPPERDEIEENVPNDEPNKTDFSLKLDLWS
jgi:hypothetical protein